MGSDHATSVSRGQSTSLRGEPRGSPFFVYNRGANDEITRRINRRIDGALVSSGRHTVRADDDKTLERFDVHFDAVCRAWRPYFAGGRGHAEAQHACLRPRPGRCHSDLVDAEAGGGDAAKPVQFPPPEKLEIKELGETHLVYSRRFRLVQEVSVPSSRSIVKRSASRDASLTFNGVLKYQACDNTICYAPVSVPVTWTVALQTETPHDVKKPQ